MKWYLKMFRRLLNTSVHNAFVFHRANKQNPRPILIQIAAHRRNLKTHSKTIESPRQGRPSKTSLPDRLTARHFIERIPRTEKNAKPRKWRAVCCIKMGKRKETCFRCKDCGVGLCLEECFRIYHTQASY
jgi:hypothetical protein